MTRVSILLPILAYAPVGGYKVAYEIGTRLSGRGYKITFLHPRRYESQSTPGEAVQGMLWQLRYGGKRAKQQVNWYSFPEQTDLQLVPNFMPRWMPPADAVIATAWQTAPWAHGAAVASERKFVNLYDYEMWKHADPATKTEMEAALRLPLKFVSTGCAADEMLGAVGQTAVSQITCGLDFDLLKLKTPIAGRKRGRIGFPYRGEAFKGAADAVSAYSLLKEKYGDAMGFTAFGSTPDPVLPDWVQYHHRLSDTALVDYYNSLSLFLLPSHYEGWGLPGTEAMACGCALVSTDSVGCRDYALPDVTALVSSPANPEALAQNLERLWLDDAERLKLANAGHEFVQRFRWERCIDGWERLLNPV